ncbi:MAG: transcriptional regulator [Paenarthrobacter sp.]
MKLTTQIRYAADGWLELEVAELPGLVAHARRVEDIPDAVRAAAAVLTGKPYQEFDVEVRY